MQCIDPFEKIFEISKDSIENLELTELLDPFLFDNHRDVINALFEVYYSLSQDYLRVFHFEKHGDGTSEPATDLVDAKAVKGTLQDRATQKLR